MTEIVNPHGRIVDVPYSKVDLYLKSGYKTIDEVIHPTGYRDSLDLVRPGEKVCIYRNYGGLGDVIIQSHILGELAAQYPHIDFTYAIPKNFHCLFTEQNKVHVIDSDGILRENIADRRSDVIRLNKEYALFKDISSPCKQFEKVLKQNLFEAVDYISRFDMWANYIGITLPKKPQSIINKYSNGQKAGYRFGIGFKSAHFYKDYNELIRVYHWLEEQGYEAYLIDSNEIEGLRFMNGSDPDELMRKMCQLDYVISVDTSIYHMACTLGIPTLGLFNLNKGEAYAKYYESAIPMQVCGLGKPCLGKNWGNCKFQYGESCYPPDSVGLIIPKIKELGWVAKEKPHKEFTAKYIKTEERKSLGRILTVVPTFNRRSILEFTLPIMRESTKGQDLWIFDDCSTEYDKEWLEQFADKVVVNTKNQGISKGWWKKIMQMIPYDRYDYIYKTDSDAICDPDLLNVLVELSRSNGNLPACGYNTRSHFRYKTNIPCVGEADVRENCPGISMLIPVEHWKAVEPYDVPINSSFDSQLAKRLPPFVVSRQSYVEHLGAGGMHNKEDQWEREIAEHPTSFLILKRREFLDSIGVKVK